LGEERMIEGDGWLIGRMNERGRGSNNENRKQNT
jgi:hypothetical protein